MDGPRSIAAVVTALDERIATMPGELAPHRVFAETYRRTTLAVAEAVDQDRFEDPGWVEEWDVVFAELYLDALDAFATGTGVPRPWRLAFDASADLPPLRHVLLGMNAHINYDLPQALLAAIPDADFADSEVLGRRRRDHARIDDVLVSRVGAEDAELSRRTARSSFDRALDPVNRLSARTFLREARRRVWHNAAELQRARARGPLALSARLAELEALSAARIRTLLAPGQVLLRLAVAGFGVTLPSTPSPSTGTSEPSSTAGHAEPPEPAGPQAHPPPT